MRFLFYLFLFFIAYFLVKLVIKSLKASPEKTTIHNSRMRKKENYENVEDAKFTEIKSDEEKKNNN